LYRQFYLFSLWPSLGLRPVSITSEVAVKLP